ncbi:VOC family protein [Luxibacter massiliensis]|uniref:VOC family protein n=1 Tax=Luxibacter massiliensis TaxID=2219695 RepID=UPI000F068110|nr:VOC family protein [Luxibacter massiliensis]
MGKLDKLTKLNDICLFVKDFQGALKFYTEKFGFRVKRLQPTPENANYAEFEFHGTAVTLWDKKGLCEVVDHQYIDGEGHHFMIAVKVPELGDVDDIASELIGNGVNCLVRPTTYEFGSRAAYFQDCEGNVWEVFAWEEGDGPGLLKKQE